MMLCFTFVVGVFINVLLQVLVTAAMSFIVSLSVPCTASVF